MRSPRAVAAALLFLLAQALSPAAERRAGDPMTVAASLPASADAALVIDRAAALRRTPAGRAIHELVLGLRLIENLDAAWPDLATELNLDSEAAFDELLGRRFILVVRTADDGSHEWAAACDVRDEIEASLRRSLRPAARGFVLNHPVLTVESGRYEIVSIALGAGQPGVRTIVLGEAARSELVESLVRAVIGSPNAPTIGETPEFRRSIAAPDERADFVLSLRSGAAGAFSIYRGRVERHAISAAFVLPLRVPFPSGAAPTLPRWMERAMLADGEHIAGSMTPGDPGDPFDGLIVDVMRAAMAGLAHGLADRIGPRFLLQADQRAGLSFAVELREAERSAADIDACMTAALGEHAPRLGGVALSKVRLVSVEAPGAVRFGPLKHAPGVLSWAFAPPDLDGRSWWLARASSRASPQHEGQWLARIASDAADDEAGTLAFAARLFPARPGSLMGLADSTRQALRLITRFECRAVVAADAHASILEGLLHIAAEDNAP